MYQRGRGRREQKAQRQGKTRIAGKRWTALQAPKMVGNTCEDTMAAPEYYQSDVCPTNYSHPYNQCNANYQQGYDPEYSSEEYGQQKYYQDYSVQSYHSTEPPPYVQCHYENYTTYEAAYYHGNFTASYCPQPEVKNVPVTMRVNLKQQLMRQHEMQRQEQQKKDAEAASSSAPQASSAVQIAGSMPSELPPQVLKVQPLLENPTRHHIKETQKRQVQRFITDSMGKSVVPNTQSLPSALTAAANSLNMVSTVQYATGSSAPVDPDSPGSVALSSTATSVDDMDLLSDLISCESFDTTMDNDLRMIEPTLAHMSQTLPQDTTYLDHGYDTSATQKVPQSSSSCPAEIAAPSKQIGGRQRQGVPPAYLTNEETRVWYRERQKKDNHNVIEKRRRLNINDKIRELGEMLPRTAELRLCSDMRQNKGTILKASVDYITKLRRDQEKLKQMEERQKKLETINRRLALKMQEMEMLMQAHGLKNAEAAGAQDLLSDVIKEASPARMPPFLKQEPTPSPHTADMMDDTSPVQGDPMVTLSSPIVNGNRNQVSVEEISDMLL